MSGFIYTLSCPDTGLVRYVGRTRDPEYRRRQHLYYAELPKYNKPFAEWIIGLRQQGKMPVFAIVRQCAYCTRVMGDWEQFYIEKYSQSAVLFNIDLTRTLSKIRNYGYWRHLIKRHKIKYRELAPIAGMSAIRIARYFRGKVEIPIETSLSLREYILSRNYYDAPGYPY